ncbi:UDP-N-acetylmuramoyl-L-alanyl-D-glutamate--2,6-diaminopimelate ligase [Alkalilimnicola sp. S0819]|uniref:UDP-N-acetylmuramoyl-L-alanyl-D-glutamate--2, 6-diaminopimelate ligase n=1 Tax=Alkalilimnicola sp. S0819 TaxID=2613922 RepID=UPI0012614B52|nr:UDP-N-acetylmuramoyl-L-alanyl-D-glutamate--2,6-diaminopimelate ligase [Alkalilimnicola sp. S0819]KAB7623851.1 UDP-N-acetylmuramoyl-L-alanyl-D-glutamate--2,6-diaminopimelate ligase [Alkalilimnicola sp. S0819]MPQ16728.1 UDP-N-acetylmuramoyl-L-alanyl-D-glutamate--2,6-diaminopimelate ligase [Alkalilimnicola sp. S0819]
MIAASLYPPGRPLSLLLASLAAVPAEQDRLVTGMTVDSRAVERGDLFLALAGTQRHGLAHVADAVERGAAAIVYEPLDEPTLESALAYCRRHRIACLAVPELSRRAGLLAARFYDEPSRELAVVGVTGTDGKTSVSQFLAQALSEPAHPCGVIGTLGYGVHGQLRPASHTTPDAVRIQALLAEARDQGARHAAMEVSSHALDQARANGVRFACAVLTNLGRDHLDYHTDMAAYAAAKAKLFRSESLRHAVLNADDAFGRQLCEELAGRVPFTAYSLREDAPVALRALRLHCRPEGLDLRVDLQGEQASLRVPLLGRFNAANVLAVLGALHALGMPLPEAVERLRRLQPVPGRMERFGGGGSPSVVVDYAHTPGALSAALQAMREHVQGRLWLVFGCGGDRDAGKRPLMGAAADAGADAVVLTDDNPRQEDGDAIIRGILDGFCRQKPVVIRNRKAAIRWAVSRAAPDDVVLVAGKGHESWQLSAGRRLAHSDRDLARKLVGRALP